MFSKIAVSALFAGFGAGLCAALLQFFFVQPILIHAELFERGELVHFGAAVTSAQPPHFPQLDMVREGLNILFSTLVYVGYALFLAVAIVLAEQRGLQLTIRKGVVFGLCGFIAAQLAPAFGLPPELPGMASAELEARQFWWFGTVLSTVVGLWLLLLSNKSLTVLIGATLIVVPHIIGAPAPDILTGPAPSELASMFAARSLGVGLLIWCILGALVTALWKSHWSEV